MYKALDLWLPAYLKQRPRPTPTGRTEIMLCVCDHFEPFHHADKNEAMARMALWKREWPKVTNDFQDADGQRPRHSFFYPIEQYDRDVINELSEVCRLSGGETEIHLHHENDTADNLRKQLEVGKAKLAEHGLLSKNNKGELCYGFIHGNWALDNSHPHGEGCGVTGELSILKETGCYADFTMPSAPSPTQTRTVNSIYYAHDLGCPKSHEYGELASTKRKAGNDDFLLVQGPLGLNWERRKFGLLPRIENGDLTGANPPTADRMRLWTRLGIHVQGQPNWIFIKLHTHAAIPRNSKMFLGDPMKRFHEMLMKEYRDSSIFRLHYVSAREVVNIVHAAEDGRSGNPGDYRDYKYKSLLKA